MNRDELLKELDTAHGARAVAFGNNPTLYSDAADEIRHLLVYIEQLKSDKHWLNERLLNAQTDIQLLEARARRND
jgi:hypothetical protein